MITKTALLYLSRQESLREIVSNSRAFQKITRRFVAGENLDDALAAIRELNRKGITASFDHLGESIKDAQETASEVREYIRILARIDEHELKSNVSVKLTQLGLDISTELCLQNMRAILDEATRRGNFVRIDMEDSSHTQPTIDLFKTLRRQYENVGIVIQSYLYRSEEDVNDLLQMGARIRLCKGAYDEPATVAFPRKEDTDRNYIKLMKLLLKSGIYHGIATHDEKIIAETIRFASGEKIGKDQFEFQMLYGIRRDLQEKLVADGYNMRVYVPYGKHWYPYFMRRLAERPANLWFVLKNMFRG